MFYKLALSNVRKSMKDYIVYFLTLAFGVCLFYVFNSIDSQQAMYEVSKSQMDIIKQLIVIIEYISVFISVILGFLILYANRFLIKRRKKEFGIYMTLGMKKSKISKIVILETFFIGVISLAIGLLIGIFLSQGLSIVTAKLFEVNLKSLQFVFSMNACLKTILYFSMMFVFVMVFNTISISRYKLIDLIYANKKNEKLRFKKLWISVLIFIASIATLGYAYYRILRDGLANFDSTLLITVILGSVGTLLFFMSLAGFLLRLIQTNKKIYFKNLNMFVLRQINSKVNTNFISMAMVCLMLFVTIGGLSGGFALANVYSKDMKATNPYDATVTVHNIQENGEFDAISTLEKHNVYISNIAKEYVKVNNYTIEEITLESIAYSLDKTAKASAEYLLKQPVPMLTLSACNQILQSQKKETISLNKDEFYIVCNIEEMQKYCNSFLQEKGTLAIDGTTLKAKQTEVLNYTLEDGLGKQDIAIVVPDEVLEGHAPEYTLINLNYIENNEKYEEEFNNMFENVNTKSGEEGISYSHVTRKFAYETGVGLKVMMLYIAVYIGIVFLITSAAVLALQQLSEASDNIERYDLLKKLGAEKAMINSALLKQIAIYFVIPLLLAIVHSIVGIKVLNDTLVLIGGTGMLTNILIEAGFILLIYGGYLIATYVGAKSIIRAK